MRIHRTAPCTVRDKFAANGLLVECEQVLTATDVRNLAQAATAAAKLAEIDRQLGALKGNGRLERARAYVRDQLRRIKLASIEAI
jgi:MoxR-like ATPase